ncbi:MAG: hypothetical protein QOG69_1549 [Actinomycetota bacterium]|nr:hypothetical protein [Actinomycetota bacterium]
MSFDERPALRPGRRGTSVAAGASLVVLGAVVGFIGLLEATALVRLGIVHLSFGALIIGPANFGLGLFAGWGLRSREAAVLPAFGWFAAFMFGGFGPRPGGDILVPGSGWDVGAFAASGLLGTVCAVAALLFGWFGATRLLHPGDPSTDESDSG